MKTQAYQNSRKESNVRRSPPANRSPGKLTSEKHWSPPVITHRRYPSLYQDFEPLFPRNRASRSTTDSNAASLRHNWRFPYVRVFAILLIIAIIAALAANA